MKLTGAKAPHERTNLTPKEQKQARKRSFALLRQMLRPYMGALAASVVSVLVAAVAAAAQPVLIARGHRPAADTFSGVCGECAGKCGRHMGECGVYGARLLRGAAAFTHPSV